MVSREPAECVLDLNRKKLGRARNGYKGPRRNIEIYEFFI